MSEYDSRRQPKSAVTVAAMDGINKLFQMDWLPAHRQCKECGHADTQPNTHTQGKHAQAHLQQLTLNPNEAIYRRIGHIHSLTHHATAMRTLTMRS